VLAQHLASVAVTLYSAKSAIQCHPGPAKGFEKDESETKSWLRLLAVHGEPLLIVLSARYHYNLSARLQVMAERVGSLPADTIHDIVPVTSGHNVTASIEEATGTNKYNASEVFGGAAPSKFVSGMWDDAYLNNTLLVLSFGTDCAAITDPILDDDGTACNSPQALTTTKGRDNVTGVGTPNAKAFVDYFRKK
jgi:hypothetical protein